MSHCDETDLRTRKKSGWIFFSIYSPVMIIVIVTSSAALLRDNVSASLGRSYALCSKPMGLIKNIERICWKQGLFHPFLELQSGSMIM